MASKAGKDLLLKQGDGGSPENFTTVGGLRATTIKKNHEVIDVTNIESLGWKELIGAGINSMALSGTGIFTDAAQLDQLRKDCDAGTLRNYQVFFSDTGNYYQGAFLIQSFERHGDYNKEQTYSVTLESSGVITYT